MNPKIPAAKPQLSVTRRSALKKISAASALTLAPGFVRYAQAQSSAPIKLGFHRWFSWLRERGDTDHFAVPAFAIR